MEWDDRALPHRGLALALTALVSSCAFALGQPVFHPAAAAKAWDADMSVELSGRSH
jgi:hypothetical protein